MKPICSFSASVLVCVCACGDAGTDSVGMATDASTAAGSTAGSSTGGGVPTSGGTSAGVTTSEDVGDTSSSSGEPPREDLGGPGIRAARCGDEPPPGAQLAPEILPYPGMCPILETGYMDGQTANILPQTIGNTTYQRSFLVIVPEDLRDDETLPVMFMWHWLGGSGKSFYERADTQNAVNEKRFIAVIPDGRETDEGTLFKWPFSVLDSDDSLAADFQFFDDMLACVAEQFHVDKDCVSSVGVSAGALFTSQLAGGRGDQLASFLSLSGGTGGTFIKPWKPPARKMPAMVLWGGPGDFCIAIDFEETSKDLEKNLEAGGHFVVECIHNCNHSTPPFEVPEGMTSYAPLWDFMFDHPYWLEPGDSPYHEEGLPPSMPEWCAVGVGNAMAPSEICDKNEC